MTISDLGSIANLLAAIGVLVTLIYLSRQVRQGNLLAKSQARQRMVEQSGEEIYRWGSDSRLRNCFVKKGALSEEEHEILHCFLTATMRQREWEWFQYKDGVIGKDVYEAYHAVIGIVLGIPRTRNWWRRIGRIGFKPEFIAEVDRLLAQQKMTSYFEEVRLYDAQPDGAQESVAPTSQTVVPAA
jgi:hypothetical protein